MYTCAYCNIVYNCKKQRIRYSMLNRAMVKLQFAVEYYAALSCHLDFVSILPEHKNIASAYVVWS